MVTAYTLAFGSLLLLGGRLSDLFGRRRTLVTGLVGFALASAVGGAAQSFNVLIAARVVQGIFAAILAPAALSLLTTTFTDPKARGKAFGVFGAISGAGAAIGLLIGGFLTQYLSWRWSLDVNLVFAAVAVTGVLLLLSKHSGDTRPRLDLRGTLTGSAGLFALVYGFSQADRSGWGASSTLGFLAGGVALLAVFIAIERRSEHPLLPLWIVTNRNRGGSLLAILTMIDRHVRRVPVPHLLPTADAWLQPGENRPRVLADDRRPDCRLHNLEHRLVAALRRPPARANRPVPSGDWDGPLHRARYAQHLRRSRAARTPSGTSRKFVADSRLQIFAWRRPRIPT